MEKLAPLFRAALDVQTFCQDNGWEFCFIGGIAFQRWGEPRMTDDADLTLLTEFENDERFAQALLSRFEARSPNALQFALHQRVLLLRHHDGYPIDIALGGLPFEIRAVRRAERWRFRKDIELLICSAEDLIVHKAFADRGKDWGDIERVISTQGKRLNVTQIFDELRPLIALKEEPEIEQRLQKLLDEHLR